MLGERRELLSKLSRSTIMMMPVVFITAFLFSIPLIKVRNNFKEPYYFFTFLFFGFFGGVVAVNLTFQKTIIEPWFIFTFATLGSVCSISAFFYLYKWGESTNNT